MSRGRGYASMPDKVMRRQSTHSRLSMEGLRYGALSNHMTFNRMMYLSSVVPEGMSIAEYLLSTLLENAMEQDKYEKMKKKD